jgi:hypothetical protein
VIEQRKKTMRTNTRAVAIPRRRTSKENTVSSDVQQSDIMRTTGAMPNAIFNNANFSSIATDANGVIQIFNVGVERMLGHSAAEVMNKITPAAIAYPLEIIAHKRRNTEFHPETVSHR